MPSSAQAAFGTSSAGPGLKGTNGTTVNIRTPARNTWLAQDAIRSPANTEAKLLMLTHAFENWQVIRVCFHTDARNQRSRAALERIGAKFEGMLRAHRMAADFVPRDSLRFSIVENECAAVKQHIAYLLDRP